MIEAFEKGIYWYVDQDVLKAVIAEWAKLNKHWEKIPYKWNAWGMKRDEIFSTGKGSKKESNTKKGQEKKARNTKKGSKERKARKVNQGSKVSEFSKRRIR